MWIRRVLELFLYSDYLFVRRALFLVRVRFVLSREVAPFEVLQVPQAADLGSRYMIYDSLLL